MPFLLQFCQWLNNTDVSVAIRESQLTFPLIEGTHLLAIGVSAGTIALADLRLMGVVMKKDPASKVLSALLPLTIGGFVVVFITGLLLFWSEPERSYINPWFRFKLVFLALAGINALVFHMGIYRFMDQWDMDVIPPSKARMAGIVSIFLWATVIWLGRQFAYSH